MVSNASLKINTKRRQFLHSSGLDRFSFETKLNPEKPDRINIVYRDPITESRMKTPSGRNFLRCRVFFRKDGAKYFTSKGGGVRP